MRSRLSAALLLSLILILAAPVWAHTIHNNCQPKPPGPCVATLDYLFNNPTGKLGTSQLYSNGGFDVTAYGFEIGRHSNTPDNLYGKNSSGDEKGLGMYEGSNTDHEIDKNDFVTMDLGNLMGLNISQVWIAVGSVQHGEGWKLYSSSTLGGLGTFLTSGTTDYPKLVDVSKWVLAGNSLKKEFLTLTSTYTGDVLWSELKFCYTPPPPGVPEPASLVLLGTGLLGMAGAVRRKIAR